MAAPRGRPSIYSDALAATICERLADGESLRQICRDDGMPNPSTIIAWVQSRPDFCERYARARATYLDILADEIVTLADESRIGEKRMIKGDGTVEVTSADMIERSRLQVDARKWVLSKLRPGVYGDKLGLDHGGSLTIKISSDDADL